MTTKKRQSTTLCVPGNSQSPSPIFPEFTPRTSSSGSRSISHYETLRNGPKTHCVHSRPRRKGFSLRAERMGTNPWLKTYVENASHDSLYSARLSHITLGVSSYGV